MAVNTLTLADIYARQGLIKEAAEIYEKILESDPSNAQAHFGLKLLRTPYTAAKAPNAAMLACFLDMEKTQELESWLVNWGAK